MKTIIIILLLGLLSINLLFSQSPQVMDKSGNLKPLYKNSYALIIGVVNYNNGWPKLGGVEKDIEIVKEILENQGFHVTLVKDPDDSKLDKAYKDFINEYGLDPENRLLMYFAGHGHTIRSSYGEELGYIVPKNAANPNNDKSGFLQKAMAMQQIEVYAKQIQSKHALFSLMPVFRVHCLPQQGQYPKTYHTKPQDR